MANIRNANTWYVDTSDASLSVTNIRVMGIILTGAGSTSVLTLGDDNSADSYPTKLTLSVAANTTQQIRLEDTPLVFPNGIRIKALTSGASATLLTSTAGN